MSLFVAVDSLKDAFKLRRHLGWRGYVEVYDMICDHDSYAEAAEFIEENASSDVIAVKNYPVGPGQIYKAQFVFRADQDAIALKLKCPALEKQE